MLLPGKAAPAFPTCKRKTGHPSPSTASPSASTSYPSHKQILSFIHQIMNSCLYIPALITLGLGLLSGCGGSSSSEQAYLPIGLQRTLDITLQDGKPYVFSFIIASESTATIYTGTSPAASTASLHVVNYKPASDSAEQIGFTGRPMTGKQPAIWMPSLSCIIPRIFPKASVLPPAASETPNILKRKPSRITARRSSGISECPQL